MIASSRDLVFDSDLLTFNYEVTFTDEMIYENGLRTKDRHVRIKLIVSADISWCHFKLHLFLGVPGFLHIGNPFLSTFANDSFPFLERDHAIPFNRDYLLSKRLNIRNSSFISIPNSVSFTSARNVLYFF